MRSGRMTRCHSQSYRAMDGELRRRVLISEILYKNYSVTSYEHPKQ